MNCSQLRYVVFGGEMVSGEKEEDEEEGVVNGDVYHCPR